MVTEFLIALVLIIMIYVVQQVRVDDREKVPGV